MANFTFTFVVTGEVATSATFTAATGPFTAPVAPGTVVGTVTVLPANWSGLITVNAPFAMNGKNVVIGSTALASGSYTINGSALP